MATWQDVQDVVDALPETENGTSYGNRAWKIRKATLAWERPLTKADREALGETAPLGDLLGLRTADLDEKDELIAAMPDVFLTIPHFDGHTAVLARLDALPVDVLDHLVRATYLRKAPKTLARQVVPSSPG